MSWRWLIILMIWCNTPTSKSARLKKLADGSSEMGEAALKDGLIDKIGIYQTY
ncbi:MAG: hypothetical protein WC938_00110 [Candidatus Paceibacterota bacterium]